MPRPKQFSDEERREKKREYDLRYQREKLKRIPLDVQNEMYEQIKDAADRLGLPVNTFLKKIITEYLDKNK